jgi:hypothetical protein
MRHAIQDEGCQDMLKQVPHEGQPEQEEVAARWDRQVGLRKRKSRKP